MADEGGLSSVEHVVLLMLENRSFDHMLGYLYADAGNVSPAGHRYEGLTGSESNPDEDGRARHFKNAKVIMVEKAGHWVHHDQTDYFVETVRDFLA